MLSINHTTGRINCGYQVSSSMVAVCSRIWLFCSPQASVLSNSEGSSPLVRSVLALQEWGWLFPCTHCEVWAEASATFLGLSLLRSYGRPNWGSLICTCFLIWVPWTGPVFNNRWSLKMAGGCSPPTCRANRMDFSFSVLLIYLYTRGISFSRKPRARSGTCESFRLVLRMGLTFWKWLLTSLSTRKWYSQGCAQCLGQTLLFLFFFGTFLLPLWISLFWV